MRLVIASRQSALARLQAYQVGEVLKKSNNKLDIHYHFRSSLGDQNANDPLWKMPERGVFTEDFYQGLVSGEWDMVVHSWKDLPVEDRQDTKIAATLPREDVRDLLLVKKDVLIKKNFKQFKVLTSSPRRAYNLSHCLKDLLPVSIQELQFVPVRGNIQTRVQKFLQQEEQALVVAKAAMDRLLSTTREEFKAEQEQLRSYLEQCFWMILPLQLNPTAAAQGALAIEIKKDRQDLQEILNKINCNITFADVEYERRQLKKWGGGCHQKIGMNRLTRAYGQVIFARGERDSGEKINAFELSKKNVFATYKSLPQEAKQQVWFERQDLPLPSWQQFNAHWVARAEALPTEVKLNPQQHLLWVSGLKTWKKLAERGLWVNGSSESLGEQEPPQIDVISNNKKMWCKWTHAEGGDFKLGETLASYRLVEKANYPQLDEAMQYFYWMSGSSFKRALEIYPWLKDKTHWCGPGHTFTTMSSLISQYQGKGSVNIALSFEEWQKIVNKDHC